MSIAEQSKAVAPAKKPLYKRWWFIAVIVIVLIVVISQMGGGKDSANKNTGAGPGTSEATSSDGTENTPTPEPEIEQGTRANPFPLGTPIVGKDWTVTINSVTLDATDAIIAENMFNEAPAEGNVYIMVNVTATYTGSDPDGDISTSTISYVTADGNTLESYNSGATVVPDALSSLQTIYEGASITGNIAFAVPADTAAQGVLAVTPAFLEDKSFVAVQ